MEDNSWLRQNGHGEMYCQAIELPPQPRLYCQQPALQHQLLQQQVCDLSLQQGHAQQATLVSSAWWPVVEQPPAATLRLPWTWMPPLCSEVADTAEPEVEVIECDTTAARSRSEVNIFSTGRDARSRRRGINCS